jgi:hypothetical protein
MVLFLSSLLPFAVTDLNPGTLHFFYKIKISKTPNITMSLQVHYICWTKNNQSHLIQLLFRHRSTQQFASHIDNTTELPGNGSHMLTLFDTVATLPL